MSFHKLLSDHQFLSVGDVSARFQVPESTCRTIIDRLQLGTRICRNRVVEVSDLPTLHLAFRAIGYNPPEIDTEMDLPRDGADSTPPQDAVWQETQPEQEVAWQDSQPEENWSPEETPLGEDAP